MPLQHTILFAVSEAAPLVRTGGLADVANGLPRALHAAGHDVRIVLPAYPDVASGVPQQRIVGQANVALGTATIRQGLMPDSNVPVLTVDHACFSARKGSPYCDENGRDWADNASRFALFAQVATAIAMGRAGLDWRPDLVHCNDWQTGLIPAYLSEEVDRPATLFTVHNLRYQGIYSRETFDTLKLPAHWWDMEKLEFHGDFSFMKGGLVFADRINTVSPSYASEIQTPEFGCGLDGLMQHRAEDMWGILNGIDTAFWDPSQSPHLAHHYDTWNLVAKRANKRDLQRELGLSPDPDSLLLVLAARLDEQKGIDLVIDALRNSPGLNCQLAVMGHGSNPLVEDLLELADAQPDRIAVRLGFDQGFSHRLFAGGDAFLMPSRFEPCGLTQMFALRFGTLPIAHRVGGISDTVFDNASGHARSNGFTIRNLTGRAVATAIERAIHCYRNEPIRWARLQQNGMGWEFSWRRSARGYLACYAETLAVNNHRKRQGFRPQLVHG
ncbi:MAG: glycogen synthase GlgA [Pseudomonadota bacterium]